MESLFPPIPTLRPSRFITADIMRMNLTNYMTYKSPGYTKPHRFSFTLGILCLLLSTFAIQEAKAVSPAEYTAKLLSLAVDPVTGLRSNEGVDILAHSGGVWMGTTNGVSFSFDGGQTWGTFDNTTGLAANNISALISINDTIWLASAGTDFIEGQSPATSGAGIQFSADNGLTWETPADTLVTNPADPTDTTGIMALATTGPFRVVFDIAGDGQRILSANFGGGLIGTEDGGVTWRRFHLTLADSLWFDNPSGDLPFTSRYFSVVADTAHTDTVIFWAGNAAGVVRWDFVSDSIKPAANRITDYAYSALDSFVYLAGKTGLTRTDAPAYRTWRSIFQRDGLPSSTVNQIHFFGGKLFVGCVDTIDGQGVGFVTTDGSLHNITPIPSGIIDSVFTTASAAVYDFSDFGGRLLYLAGGPAGLFVSADSGLSWLKIPTDTSASAASDPTNGRNHTYAVRADSLGDLWCGTDSGLVKLFINDLDPNGAQVDSALYLTFVDKPVVLGGDGAGGSVRRIEIQLHNDGSTGAPVDSATLWASAVAVSDSGEFSTYRIQLEVFPPVVDTIIFLTARVEQMAHRGDKVYFSGPDGLREIVTSALNVVGPSIRSTMVDTSRTPQMAFANPEHHAVLIVDSVTHSGTNFGFGVRTNPNFSQNKWHLAGVNLAPFGVDSVAQYTSGNSALPGDFVPALAVQYLPGRAPLIWAAARVVNPATDILQVARMDMSLPVDSLDWEPVDDLLDKIVWNFAFYGPAVYVATDEGLYYSADPASSDVDSSSFFLIDILTDNSDILIPAGSSVNGVAIIGDTLWVTTDEGTASRPLVGSGIFDIYRTIDQTSDAYAFPAPFSPNRHPGGMKFHYVVPAGATSVSISIYDFAMNLVREVNNSVSRNSGEVSTGLESDKWDGRNGVGEDVAPGIYYFKLEFSSGETQWGRLALIP